MKEREEGKEGVKLGTSEGRNAARTEGREERSLSDAYFFPCPNVAAAEFDTSIERFLLLSASLPLCLSLPHSSSTLSDCC